MPTRNFVRLSVRQGKNGQIKTRACYKSKKDGSRVCAKAAGPNVTEAVGAALHQLADGLRKKEHPPTTSDSVEVSP